MADDFLSHLVFSYKSTFHLSGKVNRHNVQHERDSPKVNMFRSVQTASLGSILFHRKQL